MVPQWYKSRLESLAQPQADGTFLIRLRSKRGRVRQVDAATKNRWIEFHQSCFWPDLIVSVLVLMAKGDNPWISTKVALDVLLYAAFIWAEYRGSLAILRDAPTVPEERWAPVAVSGYRVPRSVGLMLTVTMGVLAIVFAWYTIFVFKPSGGFWESGEWVSLLLAVLFVVGLLNYRVARRQQPSAGAALPYRAPTHWRNLIAIALAPSASAIFSLGMHLLGYGRLDWHEIDLSVWVMAVSYLLSYTFGVPFYLLARRRRWRTAGAYIWCAYLMGVAAVATLALLASILALMPAGNHHFTVKASTPFLLVGAAAIFGFMSSPIGFVYWLIARPDRPG
jgi:hypothetical protein